MKSSTVALPDICAGFVATTLSMRVSDPILDRAAALLEE